MDFANVSYEAATGGLNWAYNNVVDIPWNTLPDQAVAYLTAHPGSTIIQITSALFVVYPGLLASPIFAWVGLSNIGPVAGEMSFNSPSS